MFRTLKGSSKVHYELPRLVLHIARALVLLAGVTLVLVSALVLIWRSAALRSGDDADAFQPEMHVTAAPVSRPQPQPIKLHQPAVASRVAATPVAEAPKSNSADDPYGVMATLPAGASYTAIAVATAEAAARAKAASASNSRA
jgi:hypothetical protein